MRSRLLSLLVCWICEAFIWVASVSLLEGKAFADEKASTEQPTPAKGPASRITEKLPSAKTILPFANEKFSLTNDEVIVFTGSENMVLEQRTGALEARLAEQWKRAAPSFRHMCWEGDTVFRQNRMMEWG